MGQTGEPTPPSHEEVERVRQAALTAAAKDPTIVEEGFETSNVFALIAAVVMDGAGAENASPRKRLIRSLKTCYQFVVKNEENRECMWFADFSGKGKGKEGRIVGKGPAPVKPNVTIWVKDRDLVDLATGTANPQKLYAANRIKVRGHLDSALRIESFLAHERAKVYAVGANKTKPKRSKQRFLGLGGKSKL